jgi:hypothetical protein
MHPLLRNALGEADVVLQETIIVRVSSQNLISLLAERRLRQEADYTLL